MSQYSATDGTSAATFSRPQRLKRSLTNSRIFGGNVTLLWWKRARPLYTNSINSGSFESNTRAPNFFFASAVRRTMALSCLMSMAGRQNTAIGADLSRNSIGRPLDLAPSTALYYLPDTAVTDKAVQDSFATNETNNLE